MLLSDNYELNVHIASRIRICIYIYICCNISIPNYIGKDATDDFEDVGHSDDAREQMQKYYIGEVDATTIPARRTYKAQTSTAATQQDEPGFLFKIIQFLVPLLILGFAFGLQFLGKKEKTET